MYVLSKALGSPIVDVMRDDYTLFRELELIADEDRRAQARANARGTSKASRGGTGRRRR